MAQTSDARLDRAGLSALLNPQLLHHFIQAWAAYTQSDRSLLAGKMNDREMTIRSNLRKVIIPLIFCMAEKELKKALELSPDFDGSEDAKKHRQK